MGVAKLVIISGNCPPLRKSELEYYAMLAKVTTLPSTFANDFRQVFITTPETSSLPSLSPILLWICFCDERLADGLVRSSGLLVVNCSEWVCCRFKMEEIPISFPPKRNMSLEIV